jgi:hypothetical protein
MAVAGKLYFIYFMHITPNIILSEQLNTAGEENRGQQQASAGVFIMNSVSNMARLSCHSVFTLVSARFLCICDDLYPVQRYKNN